MEIYKNSVAKSGKPPVLSVLIPYYHDDPKDLLSALIGNKNIEVLLYDDGTNITEINANLRKIAEGAQTSISLFFATENKGRSTARNILTHHAKAKWVLFLDADMLPQSDSFIDDYLREIEESKGDIIFGGFTVASKKQSDDTELHRIFSQTSDCLSAVKRTKNGPQYVCSSNLCVRKNILTTHAFDTSFTGWGWEDSEWAARVAKHYTIIHADIPALHLGLENTETLLKRFKNSGHNYVKFTNAHPQLAKSLTLYKMSHMLKNTPGQLLMRPLLAALVRTTFAPTKLRLMALKLWRASWYAEAYP